MDEAGNTKDDLSLPKGTDDAEKLAQQIKDDFDAGKELVVTVLKVRISTWIDKLEPIWHPFLTCLWFAQARASFLYIVYNFG